VTRRDVTPTCSFNPERTDCGLWQIPVLQRATPCAAALCATALCMPAAFACATQVRANHRGRYTCAIRNTRPGVHQLPPASSTAPLLWPARSRRWSPPCRRHPALDRGPDLGGVGPSWSWAQRRAGREQERPAQANREQTIVPPAQHRTRALDRTHVHTYTHTHMRAHTAQTMRFAGQALVRISDIGHEFCDAWDMDPAAEARQKKFQAERRAAEEREVQPLKNQEQGRHCGLLLQGAGLKGNYGYVPVSHIF